jgi:hypothetical protein
MVAEPEEDPSAVGEDLLTAADIAHLRHRGLHFRAVLEGNFVALVIVGYPLPLGYDHDAVDLLIRLPAPGWPDVKPDMWWTLPWVKVVAKNAYPGSADSPQPFEGEAWQRWSRHSTTWRPGIDGLGTFLAQVDREIAAAVA